MLHAFNDGSHNFSLKLISKQKVIKKINWKIFTFNIISHYWAWFLRVCFFGCSIYERDEMFSYETFV